MTTLEQDPLVRRTLRRAGCFLLSGVILLCAFWGALALWYQLPLPGSGRGLVSLLWGAGSLFVVVRLWRRRVKRVFLAYAVALAVLFTWWSGIQPSHDRDWADDVARQLHGTVNGDRVMLENVRNFDWRSDDDYTVRWEKRQYRLSDIRSVDVVLSYWMGPAIAHTLVSFGFENEKGGKDYLSFSVEIRKERHEAFSAIAGFFKQYELVLVAADERDVLRVRSNVRGEDVYLYNVAMSPAAMRSLFLAYLDEAASLQHAPRFYDTLIANCTTIVFEMARRVAPGLPSDYRLLLSGYLPEYLYELNALAQGYELETLRASARINERARTADHAPHFSEIIRHGVPAASDKN